MLWWVLWLVLFVMPGSAQLKQRDAAPQPEAAVREEYEELRDEDEDVLQDPAYSFNPIQAQKEFKVGKFYTKKGSHRAAAGRYLEATKWDPNFAEAFLRLGEASEKLSKTKEALSAYRRYVKLAPGDKDAADVRQRITRLETKRQASNAKPTPAAARTQ